jgi:hypothetical protein
MEGGEASHLIGATVIDAPLQSTFDLFFIFFSPAG